MTNIVRYDGFNDARGHSPRLWKGVNYAELGVNPDHVVFHDDFMHAIDSTSYTVTTVTSGSFNTMADEKGGVAICAAGGSASAGDGTTVQTDAEMIIPAADVTTYFEARIKPNTIGTTSQGPEFFLGLSEDDTTLIASSANSSTNHVGWESVSDDGVLLFFGEKAGTRNAALDSPHTLVEDTYVKLGFKITGLDKVEHYVNGVLQSTTLAAANIPIVEMKPSLVCQSDGAVASDIYIDWWTCVQVNTGIA